MSTFSEAAAELAIIEHLRDALDANPRLQATVMAHPGQLSSVAMGAVADVFVKYTGSSFEKPIADLRGGVSQRRGPQFTVLLRIRNAAPEGGHVDAYSYLDRQRAAMRGWSLFDVSDAQAFEITRERLVDADEDNGVWLWEQAFEMGVPTAYEVAPVPPAEEP